MDLAVDSGGARGAAAQATEPSVGDGAAAEAAADAAAGSQTAASTEQLFQDYVSQVGPAGLQAVVASGAGFVIRTGGINQPEAADAAAEGQPGSSRCYCRH